MAWKLGEKVTVARLNAENATKAGIYRKCSAGTQQVQVGPSVYTSRATGERLGSWTANYGMWGGATIILQKLEDGSWANKATLYDGADFWGGSHSGSFNNSWGVGHYRLYFSYSAGQSSDNISGTIYYTQTSCTPHHYLIKRVDYATGNRVSQFEPTLANMESGLMGTVQSL